MHTNIGLQTECFNGKFRKFSLKLYFEMDGASKIQITFYLEHQWMPVNAYKRHTEMPGSSGRFPNYLYNVSENNRRKS